MEVPKDRHDQIAARISSSDSPVGIDARETHIIIIHKLLEIERRLSALEERISGGDAGSDRWTPRPSK